jgi:hypothetical protein
MDKLMSLMLIVLMISVSTLIFTIFQSQSVAQSYESLGNTFTVTELQNNILTLRNSEYVVQDAENLELTTVLGMACEYREDESDGITLSAEEDIQIYPEEYIEYYIEETASSQYSVQIDCNPGESGGLLRIGDPVSGDRLVEEFTMPLPDGNITEVRIIQ